jgi:hypothetical protein
MDVLLCILVRTEGCREIPAFSANRAVLPFGFQRFPSDSMFTTSTLPYVAGAMTLVVVAAASAR